MRKNLVFVRAGARSLHREHLAGDPSRNWDLCVNWYDPSLSDAGGAEYVWLGGENKIEGFASFRAAEPRVKNYSYVLIVDDDVLFAPGDVSRFFDLCRRFDLHVCQPALTWNSYFSHQLTLRNPACRVRRVSFVEIMAPCFSARALETLGDTFLLPSKSTHGVDWAWAAECTGRFALHVVDAVAVRHTKPIDPANGAFYRMLRAKGIDPEDESRSILARYPDFVPQAITCDTGHEFQPSRPSMMSPVAFDALEFLKRVWWRAQPWRHRSRHAWLHVRRLAAQGARPRQRVRD